MPLRKRSTFYLPFVALLASALTWSPRASADDASCGNVRLADVGWTDITITTAVAAELLRRLGYEPQTRSLSVPMTFMSLKDGNIDVFLGNWLPSQSNDVKPFLNEGSIEDLTTNLQGALYTFAVPKYLYDDGIHSAADLASHKELLGGRIYGIAPGNNGNKLVLDMIANNTYGLSGWTLIETSESVMLTTVKRAALNREPIVFFGWTPHPMNTTIEMAYLSDPLESWGPGGGASEVHTLISRGFTSRCPNVARLFRNLKFTVGIENHLMASILEGGVAPDVAARSWIDSHPKEVHDWLDRVTPASRAGVKTSDGEPESSPRSPLNLGSRIPVGLWFEKALGFLLAHFSSQFSSFSSATTRIIGGIVHGALRIPQPVIVGLVTLLTYLRHRRSNHAWRLTLLSALGVSLGVFLIGHMGYWEPMIESLVLVIASTSIAALAGVPTGILAARRPRIFASIRIVLDMMQTLPTFVYLIPTLLLFGIGVVPGLLSTIIFALPMTIRLTYLGLAGVPADLIEAAEAFGARPHERFFKIELPHAWPVIATGIGQALMLSLSMIVAASLVGAGGLGAPVLRALSTVNVAQGFEAGLVIVLVAIFLSRAFPRARVRAAR